LTLRKSLDQTPKPISLKWWDYQTSQENVRPETEETALSSETKLDNANSGFIEGVVELPVDGRWELQFYIGSPAYDRNAPDGQNFPVQNVAEPDHEETTTLIFGSDEKKYVNDANLQGHKKFIKQYFDGQTFRFRFEFESANAVRRLHMWISTGQITLVRDRNPPAQISTPMGTLVGKAINACDGKRLRAGNKVSNGYIKNAWDNDGEINLMLFQGSTLMYEVPMNRGSFRLKVPAGRYTCVATHGKYYSFYDPDCEVMASETKQKVVAMSPMLNPGSARIVLSWGKDPRDLDSYLQVPHRDHSNPPCEINFRNKNCHSGVIRLDVDATRGYGPETITLDGFHDGQYRFRVNDYVGRGKSGPISTSHAEVVLYTEDFTKSFDVGRDGFINKDNWSVMQLRLACVFFCFATLMSSTDCTVASSSLTVL
jgi:hypothetical protein